MTSGITLPPMLRRAELQSFWLALSGLCLPVLIVVLGLSTISLLVLLSWLAFSLLVFVYPSIARFPYRVWNKAAKVYARMARTMVLTVCYHVVFRLVSVAKDPDRFSFPRSSSSAWGALRPSPIVAYSSQYGQFDKTSVEGSWIAAFLSWAWRANHFWTVCLLPFLAMLAQLDQEAEEPSPSSTIYTLF